MSFLDRFGRSERIRKEIAAEYDKKERDELGRRLSEAPSVVHDKNPIFPEENVAPGQLKLDAISVASKDATEWARDCVPPEEVSQIESLNRSGDVLPGTISRMVATLRYLRKENGRLLNKIATTPSLDYEIERHHFQKGDVIVMRHQKEGEYLEDLNSFGFGLSALNTLKRKISEVVGGEVLVIATKSDLNVSTLPRHARAQLRAQLDRMDETDQT